MTILRIGLALAALCLAAACDNDVELLSDDPGVPVVYGLIDGSRDQQVLSVTRTFRFSEGSNALESARQADSVYYSAEGLTVVARNQRTGTSTTLSRRDFSADGVVRPEGVFAPEPVIGYTWDLSAVEGLPGDSIQIEGSIEGGGTFATGGVLLPMLEPRNLSGLPNSYNLLGDRGETQFRFDRGDVGAEIAVFEVGLNLEVTEIVAGGEERTQVLYYPLERNRTSGVDRNSISVANERFNGVYGFLSDRLEADPEVTRRLDNVQGVVIGGDAAFVEFRTLQNANSGITATQELPVFSNVDGGLGLISAVTRLEQRSDATLNARSLDSLREGFQTRDLNFCITNSSGNCR